MQKKIKIKMMLWFSTKDTNNCKGCKVILGGSMHKKCTLKRGYPTFLSCKHGYKVTWNDDIT